MARTTLPDRIATHPHVHCHKFFLHLTHQIACHGVNHLTCQCEACFIFATTTTITIVSTGPATAGEVYFGSNVFVCL